VAAIERLQRFLARAGVASRRRAEDLIRGGRVAVNGRTVTDPAARVAAGDEVRVDGRPVVPEAPVVLALHKPAGYVSTARDPQGRPTVLDLVPAAGRRLYPVGRLDATSEGLLLLTNDGDLTQLLTHPRHGLPKTYRVRVDRTPGADALERLRRGVRLADGPTRPADVELEGDRWLRITIREGRHRQVRRMCAAVGLDVERLIRVAVDGLELGGLPPGACRALTAEEVEMLRRAAKAGQGSAPGAKAEGSGEPSLGARRRPGGGRLGEAGPGGGGHASGLHRGGRGPGVRPGRAGGGAPRGPGGGAGAA
jgi:23S rRNA pseudouridine2605 synthase